MYSVEEMMCSGQSQNGQSQSGQLTTSAATNALLLQMIGACIIQSEISFIIAVSLYVVLSTFTSTDVKRREATSSGVVSDSVVLSA